MLLPILHYSHIGNNCCGFTDEVVAFAVEDGVAEALVEAEGKGIRLIDKDPRLGAENMMIGFLHPKMTAGILTELCEPKKA